MTPEQEYVLRHITPIAEGCWLWTGRLDRGYGRACWAYVTPPAHRFSYEVFNGPIPAGLQIDHLCRTPACVNPTHLEPVTAHENTRRSNSITARNAAKTHCPRGHEYSLDNTYLWRSGFRECATCHRAKKMAQHAALRDGSARVVHGQNNTYANYGCRCEPCSAAQAAYGRARRKAAA